MTATTVSRLDCLRIAARAGCDPRTVRRSYEALPVRLLVLSRITEAAGALGLPPPPLQRSQAA